MPCSTATGSFAHSARFEGVSERHKKLLQKPGEMLFVAGGEAAKEITFPFGSGEDVPVERRPAVVSELQQNPTPVAWIGSPPEQTASFQLV